MLNSQRLLVESVKKYCNKNGITLDVRSQGWLLSMQRGEQRRFALGYDLGLNSSVTHRIVNDKAATSEVLEMCGVPSVLHTLFLNPRLADYVPPTGTWEAMLALFEKHSEGIVVKPNEGTGGQSVFLVRSKPKLELAANEIFARNRSLTISPFLEIEDEIRLIMVNFNAVVVYSKKRPFVMGDGNRTLLELALEEIPGPDRSSVLPSFFEETDSVVLDEILPSGVRKVLNWRHNLGHGAEPVLLDGGQRREECIQLAVTAARALGLRFGSVDLVLAGGHLSVLEVNSGVMMEALGKKHAELVDATYGAALDQLFS